MNMHQWFFQDSDNYSLQMIIQAKIQAKNDQIDYKIANRYYYLIDIRPKVQNRQTQNIIEVYKNTLMSQVTFQQSSIVQKQQDKDPISSPHKQQSNRQSKQENKPISSPTKQERRQKKLKTQAFKSFLQRGQQSGQKIQLNKENKSDHQDVILQESGSQCAVCRQQLGKNKKQCAFCKQYVCNQHARKKRKSKDTGKFARICDDCEDKHLFQKYMMMEVKAEESLIAQQQIIKGKHSELESLLQTKKAKKTLCDNKAIKLKQEHKDFLKQLQHSQNQVKSKLDKLSKKQVQFDAQQVELQKIEAKLPRSLDDDYASLTQQNQKITKQLVKYEKQCNEAIKVKSKKEKEIYDKYYEWQNREKTKLTKKQSDSDCIIF